MVTELFLFISGTNPRVWRELLVAGLSEWMLAGARLGGLGYLWSGGGVWGWKDQRSGLEGL